MLLVVVVTVVYAIFVRLVFFKFKLLRLTPAWGVVTAFVFLHLVLVPLVGMRFVAPVSEDLRVVRPTVQLVPRLPEPTLVEQVLVQENVPVKKGDPLFVFDKRLYQFQVDDAEAALAAAKQNVEILQADVDVAAQSVTRARAKLDFDRLQEQRFVGLAAQRAAPQEQAQQWTAQVAESEASVAEAVAEWQRARIAFDSQINGVNTAVAEAGAQLKQAEYFLEQTVVVAPADGMIINLQVEEGMVAGIVRFGAIASFIIDEPYILATYRQENLKFVDARPVRGGGAQQVSRPAFQREGRGDLVGQRQRPVPALRRSAGLSRRPFARGAVPGQDQSRRPLGPPADRRRRGIADPDEPRQSLCLVRSSRAARLHLEPLALPPAVLRSP